MDMDSSHSRYFFEEGKFLVNLFVKLFKESKLEGYAEGESVHLETEGANLTLTTWTNDRKETRVTSACFFLGSFSDLVNVGNFVRDFAAVRKQNQ